MDFLQLVAAVLAANLLTLMFVYGMAKAFRIGPNDAPPLAVGLSLVIPLLAVAAGAWLFGG